MNYYIGIDGGGTQSKGILVSEDGRTSAQATAGPSNINNIGLHPAIKNLSELVNLLLEQAGIDCVSLIGFGLSGAGREDDRHKIDQALQTSIGGKSQAWMIHHDAYASLMGASGTQDGVIAIAGTGSIVYGIKDEQEVRAGGWGYLLGDEGSGYFIGNLTLRILLNDFDHLLDAGDIRQPILDFYHLSGINQIISQVYSSNDPKGMISSCCETIFELAQEGSPTALSIIHQSNQAFAHQIHSVFQRLKMEAKLLFPTGSLFKNIMMQKNLETLIYNLDPEIQFAERRYPPEIGMILAVVKHHQPEKLPALIRELNGYISI